jgi:hypothetical protein
MDNEVGSGLQYHKLLEALTAQGCAICHLISSASFRFIDSLLYEFVTDGPIRSTLIASNGFCNWHVWMAVKITSAQSGLAIIYQSILESILARDPDLNTNRNQERNSPINKVRSLTRKSPGLSKKNTNCLICGSVEQFETSFLEELLLHLHERDFRTAFEQSFGICFRHLKLAAARYPNAKNLSLLVEIERRKVVADAAIIIVECVIAIPGADEAIEDPCFVAE